MLSVIDWVYFDVYDAYSDDDGYLRMDLSDGHVHITDGTHIRALFESMFILETRTLKK